MPEEARRDMLAKTAAALPVGRVGKGEDVALQILAFMANGFATGSIVYLDAERWSPDCRHQNAREPREERNGFGQQRRIHP